MSAFPLESMRRDWHNLPNLVTSSRLLAAAVPAVMLLFGEAAGWRWAAVGAFLLIAATDSLDGYLARSRKQVTDWGTFLDPLVDKVLITITLTGLCVVYPVLIPVAAFIVIRELYITFRLRMTKKVIPAIRSGKRKMLAQVLMSLVWLAPLDGMVVGDVARWMLTAAAVVLTLISWVDYERRFIRAPAGSSV